MNDYIIVDDFFENPDEIREWALNKFHFHLPQEHPEGVGQFPGIRTSYFHKLDFCKSMYDLMVKRVDEAIMKMQDLSNMEDVYLKHTAQFSFSLTYKNSQTFLHKDDTTGSDIRYAGVIYLHPNPENDTGTLIYDRERNHFETVSNKYNRFVLYNSQLPHQPQGNFGNEDDKYSGRLVLTIFFDLYKRQETIDTN